MTEPTFGITFNQEDTDPRPVIPSDLSVIGLIATAANADPSFFPLNTPVSIVSNDTAALTAAGSSGTLLDALKGIDANLAEFESAARVVVVRVADNVDDNVVIANMVGDLATYTGVNALLRAGPDLGVIPRLIIAPGYTHQHSVTGGATGVTEAPKSGGNTGNGTMVLAGPAYGAGVKAGVYQVRCIGGAKAAASAAKGGGNTGTGAVGSLTADTDAAVGVWRAVCTGTATNAGSFSIYRPDGTFDGVAIVGVAYNSPHGPNFTISDGGTDFVVGDEFDITVTNSVPANGGTFSVTDPDGIAKPQAVVGTPYTDVVKFTINDGATDFVIGDGFDVTVAITGATALANAVCAALPAVLDKLIGHAIVEGPGTTDAEIQTWVESLPATRRLIPVDAWAKVQEGASIVTRPGVSRIAGLAVAADYERGGIPSRSWANRQVFGILGWNRNLGFSLTDGASQGQILLSEHVGVGLRGEMGVESAIGSTGSIFVGTDGLDPDPIWQFYHETRTRDYIHLGLLKTLRGFLGQYNIVAPTIDALLRTASFFLRDMAATNDIYPTYKVSFEPDKNSPENLRLGKFRFYFACEEPPVLRQLTIDSRRDRNALVTFVDDLFATVSVLAA